MDQGFLKGLKLSELFFAEAVRPILEAHFPGLVYSAARLDYGSDVLGYDTPRSMDHGWGPKLQLFLSEADYETYRAEIIRVLGEVLPYEIRGYPIHFASPEVDGGWLEKIEVGPVNHGVTVHTLRSFFVSYLGVNPQDAIRVVDWLTFPEQRLRTVAVGNVFYDGLDELERFRETLRYYPRDVWLYLLASQWRWIDQEEPFMGRCGELGDELGSRLIAAHLVRELMKLCFLMEKQYVPYSKWFGTAFAELQCAIVLAPVFESVWNARNWQDREAHLSAAYESVAEMHNALAITRPLPTKVSQFYSRPYHVIHSGRFVEALRNAIVSEEVRRLPEHLGSVNQFVDSTDVLDEISRLRRLRVMYLEEGR